jgi:hypothetical protein
MPAAPALLPAVAGPSQQIQGPVKAEPSRVRTNRVRSPATVRAVDVLVDRDGFHAGRDSHEPGRSTGTSTRRSLQSSPGLAMAPRTGPLHVRRAARRQRAGRDRSSLAPNRQGRDRAGQPMALFADLTTRARATRTDELS